MALIANINPSEDGLIYTANNTRLKIGDKIVGKGILYISQSSFGWQADNMSEGISIQWKQISVHGISSNPCKCIYFMLDHNLEWRGVYDKQTRASALNVCRNGNVGVALAQQINGRIVHMEQQLEDGRNVDVDEGNVTDDESDHTDDHLTECWILPDDVNTVEIIFQAMTECQALHPDSAESLSEESDFMDDDDDENNVENISASVGNRARDDTEDAQGGIRNLNLNDERFADADE